LIFNRRVYANGARTQVHIGAKDVVRRERWPNSFSSVVAINPPKFIAAFVHDQSTKSDHVAVASDSRQRRT
jgi:hypothetical protein